MQVQLTGQLTVHGPDATVDSTALAGRQGRVVLASLALADQPVPREVLADRVWATRLPRAWERDLSAVVSKLRAALTRAGFGGPEMIASDGATYHLRLSNGAEVDVRAALEDATAGAAALAAGDAERAGRLAERVLAVTARPFLPAEDAPWVDDVRRQLRQAHRQALETLAESALARGAPDAAEKALQDLLDLDPYRESAVRLLMRLYLDGGRRAEAVQVHEQLRARLADDLGLDPSPETQQLHLEALRHDTTPAVAPDDEVPPIRYARSGTVSIAYQVVGDGPVDLVAVPGWISNIELAWQEPHMAAFLRALAQHCRLILFDKRGTGLSDPIPIDAPPPLDVRMDDVTAVMDAVGSERAVLFGFSEGGAMSLLFAASHPDRTRGLVLWGTWARQMRGDDFPYGWTREEGRRRFAQPILDQGRPSASWFVPSRDDDPGFQAWFARYARQSASPGMALALLRANARMDVREVLPHVRVPTLVLHRTDDVLVQVEQGRLIAQQVPGARMVEFPGRDHWPWFGEARDLILAEMLAFVEAAASTDTRAEQVLATLVALHPATPVTPPLQAVLAEHRGLLVEDQGTVVARFDGPGRAVRCARALVAAAPSAAAGVHTGEVTVSGVAVSGHALDVSQAVAAAAPPGEVLVTRTVTDLVAGSPMRFDEPASHDLGPLGTWPLARVS